MVASNVFQDIFAGPGVAESMVGLDLVLITVLVWGII